MKTLLILFIAAGLWGCKKKAKEGDESPTEITAPLGEQPLDDSDQSTAGDPGMAATPVPDDNPSTTPKTEPEVQNFSPTGVLVPSNGTYGENGHLIFQLQFSGITSVDGTPYLNIQIGSETRKANYTTGTGTSGLEFSYTIQSGDTDADGIEVLGVSTENSSILNDQGALLDTNISSLVSSLGGVFVDTSAQGPNQVTGLAIAPTTSANSISITWSVPDGNGSSIINYVVQSRKLGDDLWTSQTSTLNLLQISNLEEATSYEFRVAGNNGLLGAFSDIAVASTFNILDLNPIAWLDATDPFGDGTQPPSGTLISSWTDKTGKASAAEEADPARQPSFETDVKNGLPAIRFADKAVGLEGTFTRTEGTDLTIVIVGQFDDGYTDRCLFEFRNGNARAFFIDRRYASNTFYSPNITKGSFQLWQVENKGGSAKVFENGGQIFDSTIHFNTDFTGDGQYVLGDDTTGNNRLFGYIGEILIFDKQLSVSETAVLTNYLNNKWSLD